VNRNLKISGGILGVLALGVVIGILLTPVTVNVYSAFLGEGMYNTASFGEGRLYNVIVWHYDKNGNLLQIIKTHNVITNAGMNFTQHLISNPSDTETNRARYIAVTNSSITPSYTDTSLTGEMTTSGMARASGTFYAGTASSGDITWKVYYNFTYTGSGTTVYGSGLFNKASGGTLYAIATFSSNAILSSGDKLNVQWEITAQN